MIRAARARCPSWTVGAGIVRVCVHACGARVWYVYMRIDHTSSTLVVSWHEYAHDVMRAR